MKSSLKLLNKNWLEINFRGKNITVVFTGKDIVKVRILRTLLKYK